MACGRLRRVRTGRSDRASALAAAFLSARDDFAGHAGALLGDQVTHAGSSASLSDRYLNDLGAAVIVGLAGQCPAALFGSPARVDPAFESCFAPHSQAIVAAYQRAHQPAARSGLKTTGNERHRPIPMHVAVTNSPPWTISVAAKQPGP